MKPRIIAVVGTAMASFVVEDFSLKRTLRIKPGEIQERVGALTRMVTMPPINARTLVQV